MPPTATAKKERGCFQCSRRRISCDRAQPSCLKCVKKGIACSGLGRIRFLGAVASRGRFKDCKVPRVGEEEDKEHVDESSSAKEATQLSINKPGELRDDAGITLSPPTHGTTVVGNGTPTEEIHRGCDAVVTAYHHRYHIVPWVAPIEPTSRMLFSYCMTFCEFSFSLRRPLITAQSPMSSHQSWSCLMTPRMATDRWCFQWHSTTKFCVGR